MKVAAVSYGLRKASQARKLKSGPAPSTKPARRGAGTTAKRSTRA